MARVLSRGSQVYNSLRFAGLVYREAAAAIPAPQGEPSQPTGEVDWRKLLEPLLEPDAPLDQVGRALAFLRIYARTLLDGSPWDVPQTMGAALMQVVPILERAAQPTAAALSTPKGEEVRAQIEYSYRVADAWRQGAMDAGNAQPMNPERRDMRKVAAPYVAAYEMGYGFIHRSPVAMEMTGRINSVAGRCSQAERELAELRAVALPDEPRSLRSGVGGALPERDGYDNARFWREIDALSKREVAELLRHTQYERDRAVEQRGGGASDGAELDELTVARDRVDFLAFAIDKALDSRDTSRARVTLAAAASQAAAWRTGAARASSTDAGAQE